MNIAATTTSDIQEIMRFLKLIYKPGEVRELRIPKTDRLGIVSGYYDFDHLVKLVNDAASYSGKTPGIYLTINPVNPALLSRYANRIQIKADKTTTDKDIAKRAFLPIDIDAGCPSGISSTDSEHQVVIDKAYAIQEFLQLIGAAKQSMIIGDSGNGAYVLLALELPNDTESNTLCQNVLQALCNRFDIDKGVHIDPTTYNASRITKVYGTLVMKGDNTPDRPHRIARLLSVPDTVEPIGRDILESIASEVPTQTPPPANHNGHGIKDLKEWLTGYGIKISKEKDYNGHRMFILKECPNNPEHNHGEVFAIQFTSGAVSFKCHHASCQSFGWHELRLKYEPNAYNKQPIPQPKAVGQPELRRMADVKAEAVSWLWKPYIPKGKVTLEEGDPGIGKSWASLAIATAVSLGKGLPGQEPSEPANVVIASAEDGLGDTIRPRLDAMGADINRIFVIDGALTLDETGFATLRSYLEQTRPALLIIDPLVAYLGAGVNIFRANETRAVMAQLARLAEQFGVAILAVRHLTKGGQLKAIYRGLGSIDFTAACRSVLLAGCDAENPQNRALVHIKHNLTPAGPSIGYELKEGSFYWTGESSLTAAQILAADSGDSTSVMDEAIAFLREELASGPMSASQVFNDGKGAGLSEITIKRAKARLEIVTRRQGETGKRGGGRFTWELPDSHLEDQKDLEYQEAHIEKNDTLNNSSLKSDPLPKTDDTLNTPDSDIPDHPIAPCPNCGCGDYWLRESSQWGPAEWLCSRCHPKPGGKL